MDKYIALSFSFKSVFSTDNAPWPSFRSALPHYLSGLNGTQKLLQRDLIDAV